MRKHGGTPVDAGLAEEMLYERLLSSVDADFPECPAVAALKNGALMTGFWYRGPDLEAAGKDEINRVCAGVHEALAPFGLSGGWIANFEGLRGKRTGHLPRCSSAAAVDVYCDEERESRATFFETHHAMFLTFIEAREDVGWIGRIERFARGESSFSEFLSGGDQRDAEAVCRDLLNTVNGFELKMQRVARALQVAGIDVRRMHTRQDNCELLQALNYVVNGGWQTVRPPADGGYLDVLLADELHVDTDGKGAVARHGRRAYQIVEPMRFPDEGEAQMLETLEQLPVEWRRSTRAIFVGTSEAVAQLENVQTKWDGLRIRLRDAYKALQRPRQSAVKAADEVSDALEDIEGGRLFGVHVTTVVVVSGETTAEARAGAREVERAFQLAGVIARTQVKNTRNAYLGSFPGHGYHNVRRPFVSSLNLVHKLSLSAEWGGEAVIPSKLYPAGSPALLQARARSKSRFFVNLHSAPGINASGQGNEDMAHAAVFGPIGAGKSVFVNALVSQFLVRYKNSRAVYLDNGFSAYKLTRSRGNQGAHFTPGSEGLQLHPFARIHEDRWFAFAMDFVAGLARRYNVPYGEQDRTVVREALVRLRGGRRAEDRSLRRLWMDINEPRRLKELLEDFVLGGGRGVIDGERDLLTEARLTCFELGALLNRDPAITQTGLHFLLEHVRGMPTGTPLLVVLDEAGLALRDATIARHVDEMILGGRKLNVHFVLLFHSPKQLLDSPVATTVRDNVQTRFWLPNSEASNPDEKAGYREMGLSRELLALIATARRKQEYIYQSGPHTRVFELDLGPVQHAFWGFGGPEDLALVRAIENEYEEWWPAEYLRRKGMRDEAARWEALHGARRRARGAA